MSLSSSQHGDRAVDHVKDGHATLSNEGETGVVPTSPSSAAALKQSAAAAAEARAAELRSQSSVKPEDSVDRMRFHRCLDQDLFPPLLAPVQRAKMVGVLTTVLLLLENALNKGIGKDGDAKYLHVKLSNPAIRQRLDLANEIVKHPAGPPSLDWLQLSGWRQTVQNFQEHLVFPADPSTQRLAELQAGVRILKDRLGSEEAKLSASRERQKAANAYEANRKLLAMQQYKEDRELRREKDERAKQARAAASPTSPLPTFPLSSPSTRHYDKEKDD